MRTRCSRCSVRRQCRRAQAEGDKVPHKYDDAKQDNIYGYAQEVCDEHGGVLVLLYRGLCDGAVYKSADAAPYNSDQRADNIFHNASLFVIFINVNQILP